MAFSVTVLKGCAEIQIYWCENFMTWQMIKSWYKVAYALWLHVYKNEVYILFKKYERIFTEIKSDDLWVVGLQVILTFCLADLYFQPFYTEHILIYLGVILQGG